VAKLLTAGMALDISGGGIESLATSTEEQDARAAHPNTIATIRIKNFPNDKSDWIGRQ
jgi:hypothetical protein